MIQIMMSNVGLHGHKLESYKVNVFKGLKEQNYDGVLCASSISENGVLIARRGRSQTQSACEESSCGVLLKFTHQLFLGENALNAELESTNSFLM